MVSGEFSQEVMRDGVWAEWTAGALTKDEYLGATADAGFRDITVRNDKSADALRVSGGLFSRDECIIVAVVPPEARS